MSRPSSIVAPRNLSLTEELEKLEQSITLTLQEIDHNFSRAHRIVTSSILPIVEQYAKHSEAVWDGSKFWKEFFEASANVSLAGYEEQTAEDTTVHDEETESTLSPGQQEYHSPSNIDESIASPGEPTTRHFSDDEDFHSSPSMGGRHSTPRMPPTATKTMRSKQPAEEVEEPSFAEYPSPYETLKRQVEGKSAPPKHSSHQPRTPGKASVLPDMSMTPTSSPFEIDFDIAPPSTSGKNNKDTILHQGILNKTYRVAATPHTARKNKALGIGATPQTANRTRRILDFEDTMSSPLEEAPAPRLRAEFFSPVKGPRTPGVSVHTPGRKRFGGLSFEPAAAKDELTRGRSRVWSDDDDDDDDLLESPPKTIMFNLPESRVLQTPAQEASRRMVQDILYSAGGDFTDDLEDSPSIVQRNHEMDETF
ncbi:hypothetical protein EG327_008310 [Venturia inaequalis]|uniref:DASH complex subunit ASK1 n=1 Tax=Venturia inaequalis TaxID=5025 RepID=A0A8H3UW64_VENIN|nr:hypothetical protein EG327_008310 [Venturia inaequalis]